MSLSSAPAAHLVGEQVPVHQLGPQVEALDEALQRLGVLGAHQLQQPEQADGQELAVQCGARGGALRDARQRLLAQGAAGLRLQVLRCRQRSAK